MKSLTDKKKFYIKTIRTLFKNRVPGQLIIQYADHCNAKCPQCGMNTANKFQRNKLEGNTVRSILDHAANLGFHAVSFTGGEPLLFFDEIMEFIYYASTKGIKYSRTGTNGFIFRNSDSPNFENRMEKIAKALKQSGVYTFWISMDSSDPVTHEKLRGLSGVIPGVKKALPIFHDYGVYPSANLGINRKMGEIGFLKETGKVQFFENVKKAFMGFYDLAVNLGFTIINSCYPMSVQDNGGMDGLNPVYGATAQNSMVNFSPGEKALIFKAMMEVIPKYRHKIRIFSPLSSLYALYNFYENGHKTEYPCRGGIDYFFINAASRGDTFPCGFRGMENLGKFWELNVRDIDASPYCMDCDWECFRDPGELFGPFTDLFQKPFSFFKKAVTRESCLKLWFSDLSYYRACGFFNCGKKPDYKRLARFHGKQ